MRLKWLNLSELGQGAAEAGAEPEDVLEQSTVFCLGSLNLVNFSPIEAWRNQGREIFRREELPPFFADFAWLLLFTGLVVAIAHTRHPWTLDTFIYFSLEKYFYSY